MHYSQIDRQSWNIGDDKGRLVAAPSLRIAAAVEFGTEIEIDAAAVDAAAAAAVAAAAAAAVVAAVAAAEAGGGSVLKSALRLPRRWY